MSHRLAVQPLVLLLILVLLLPAPVPAQEEAAVASVDRAQLQDTIETLQSLLQLQTELKRDIQDLNRRLQAAQTEAEKKDMQAQLDKLEADLETTAENLKGIAAGADITSLRVEEEKKFSLQEELFSLLKPALKEMRDSQSCCTRTRTRPWSDSWRGCWRNGASS